MSMKSLSRIITHTSRLAHAGAWEELNEELQSLDFDAMSTDDCNAWIRCTYAMREHLAAWAQAVVEARAIMEARGERDVLRGL